MSRPLPLGSSPQILGGVWLKDGTLQREFLEFCRGFSMEVGFGGEKYPLRIMLRSEVGLSQSHVPAYSTQRLHYGLSFPVFTRTGVRIRRNLCIREGVRIHTRCVYALPLA